MDPRSLPDQPAPAAATATVDPPARHGPYEYSPPQTFIASAQRAAMLTQALHGVQLGTWDTRILGWLCHWSDEPTFLAILGWVERARVAAQPAPQHEVADPRRQPLIRLAGVAGDFWSHAHSLLGTLERLAATEPEVAVLYAQTELLIADYEQAKAAYNQAADRCRQHDQAPPAPPQEDRRC